MAEAWIKCPSPHMCLSIVVGNDSYNYIFIVYILLCIIEGTSVAINKIV
jgi:hypothetical protein